MNFADPDEFVKPHPLTIAVNMINTDWAKATRNWCAITTSPIMRGVRDYCQAYHGGPNRQEMIDLLVRTGTEARPELLHKYPWPARNPNGSINVDSMLDIQAWFVRTSFTQRQVPGRAAGDRELCRLRQQKLGPFVLENKDSKLAGCR